MIKKRIIGIILILLSAGILLFISQLRKNIYGEVRVDLGKYFIEFPHVISIYIFIILILIGIGMILIPFFTKDMKKGLKENINLIIFWFSLVAIVSLLLIFLKSHTKINNIIQAITLLTLVFITWIYARQTQKLVKEENKKRMVDFFERRISDFYKPLSDILDSIKVVLAFLPDDIDTDDLKKQWMVSWDLFTKKSYMVSKETSSEIREVLYGIIRISDIPRREYIDGLLTKAERLTDIIESEWDEIEEKIRKIHVY